MRRQAVCEEGSKKQANPRRSEPVPNPARRLTWGGKPATGRSGLAKLGARKYHVISIALAAVHLDFAAIGGGGVVSGWAAICRHWRA